MCIRDSLWRASLFVDVALRPVAGAPIDAHRIVLAAASPALAELLKPTDGLVGKPTVDLPVAVSAAALRAMLEHVYTGVTRVPNEAGEREQLGALAGALGLRALVDEIGAARPLRSPHGSFLHLSSPQLRGGEQMAAAAAPATSCAAPNAADAADTVGA
eukprot:2084988-Pleurochrysis_carterae.AAC.1